MTTRDRCTARPLPVVAVVLAALACGTPKQASSPVVTANKTIWWLVATGAHLGFLDGAEASSDPSLAGVEVRVALATGQPVLDVPADRVVRGIALNDAAIATIEMQQSVDDQRVRIRPLGGGAAVEPVRQAAPLAITTEPEGFAWLEASIAGTASGSQTDFVYDLTLVESDSNGGIQARTAIQVSGGVTAPASLLAPYPEPFGLAVSGSTAYFGWLSTLCGGGAVVYQIDRASGAATVAWNGRIAQTSAVQGTSCQCVDAANNVEDWAKGLSVAQGSPIIVGATRACASVAGGTGFAVGSGALVPATSPLDYIAADDTGIFVADESEDVFTLSGGKLASFPLPAAIAEAVTGLALDPKNVWIATSGAIRSFPR